MVLASYNITPLVLPIVLYPQHVAVSTAYCPKPPNMLLASYNVTLIISAVRVTRSPDHHPRARFPRLIILR